MYRQNSEKSIIGGIAPLPSSPPPPPATLMAGNAKEADQGRTQRGGNCPPDIFVAKKKKKKNYTQRILFFQIVLSVNQKIMQLQVKLINQRIVHGHSPFYVERHYYS